MKKPKTAITKVVIGAVSSSILAASCSKGYDFENSVYGPFADNKMTRGISLIDVEESNLSDEFVSRIEAVSSIVNLILTDKKEAKLFSKNTETYLASKELSLNITLTNQEKKLLVALSDEDIIKAVRNKDLQAFLNASNDKGYLRLSNEENGSIELRRMFKTEKSYDQFVKSIEGLSLGQSSPEAMEALIAVAAVVVYIAAGAVIYAAAATIAETYLAVHHKVAAWGTIPVNTSMPISVFREPVLKIWTDNNGPISDPNFYSELIDKQTSVFVNMLEAEFSNVDKHAVAELFKQQLEGYYGLK